MPYISILNKFYKYFNYNCKLQISDFRLVYSNFPSSYYEHFENSVHQNGSDIKNFSSVFRFAFHVTENYRVIDLKTIT